MFSATVYDFHKFSIDEPYVKEVAYGPNYNAGGVVYFGANYDGGIITGYNSLFTAQAG